VVAAAREEPPVDADQSQTRPVQAIPAGRDPSRCSFCGKRQEQVDLLIAGPGNVYICDECVDLCAEQVASLRGQPPTP
jgi:hypothetical protein